MGAVAHLSPPASCHMTPPNTTAGWDISRHTVAHSWAQYVGAEKKPRHLNQAITGWPSRALVAGVMAGTKEGG